MILPAHAGKAGEGCTRAAESGLGSRAAPTVAEERCELAPAKVNLSLRVLGRRRDGYHELESLVVFAGVGDVVCLRPGEPIGLTVGGPGASQLDAASNLVLRAAQAAGAACDGLATGHFRLDKHLPVAAGLGGGSADAAAALRLIRTLNARDDGAARLDWMAVAASVGADVPVCLVGRPALMTGLGETVRPLPAFPEAWLVLANPGVPLATADVFRALSARALAAPPPPVEAPGLDSLDAVVAWLEERPNDLEPVARRLCPAVEGTLAALAGLEGACLARMSGSGPTCFAVFADAARARAGADALAAARPGWWIAVAPILV